MKLTDAVKILENPTGQHLEQIYVPSLGREIMFHPLTTADVKTLTRMNFIDNFDLNIEALKLGLFDKLCAEDLSDTAVKDENGNEIYPAINAQTITQIDYLSFLIGIRNLLNNHVTFTFTCHQENCEGGDFDHTIKLDELFDDLVYNFKRQTLFWQRTDKTGNIWKFELTNFTMYEYLYFRYFMEKLEESDEDSPDVAFEEKFVKPVLYIKNIWLNDEIIEDWGTLTIPDKLSFWNRIPPELTINTIGTKHDTLYDFIFNAFAEEEMEHIINDIVVACPKCGMKYGGAFSFDNFFMF
jgi:hypothetical protein